MTQRVATSMPAMLEKQYNEYLKANPEVAEYLRQVEKAQELFGGFLRLGGPQVVIQELEPSLTSEVDFELNATLSPTSS